MRAHVWLLVAHLVPVTAGIATLADAEEVVGAADMPMQPNICRGQCQ